MISIIVPVYNTSRYLHQCIKSILKQDFTDFELILVDDASSDNSRSIIEFYEKKDDRIHCILKDKNEGVDYARFSGLSVAKGEYITFVDSDDWLTNNSVLGKMVKAIEETGADYVEISSQHVMDRFGLIKLKCKPSSFIIKQPELFDNYYITFFGSNLLSVSIFGKLYRKAVIDKANLSPSGFRMGEDLMFNLMLFPHLQSIAHINCIGYNYRYGGMTTRYNPSLLSDLKKQFFLKDNLAKEYHYDRAFDLLRVEMKNVLRSDICQRIIFLKASKEEIINSISEELKDPVYQRIGEVKSYPNFYEDPFVIAILNKDAISIYDQCKNYVDNEKWKRLIKRIGSRVLSMF